MFDSLAQTLNQVKPEINASAKSLRTVCKNFAMQENLQEWFTTGVTAPRDNLNRSVTLEQYTKSIEYTAGENNNNPKHIIWGLPEIEGRIICIVYGIRLHLVEGYIINNQNYQLHQIIDGSGSKSANEDRIYYSDNNTIHVCNKGTNHFEPLLREQIRFQNCDYYSVLEVDRKCSNKKIKNAYNKLAPKCHPDKHPGYEEKFKEINKANKVLPDLEKRSLYDLRTHKEFINLKKHYRKDRSFDEIKQRNAPKLNKSPSSRLSRSLNVLNGIVRAFQSLL